MRPKTPPLFTGEPVEMKQAEALAAIQLYVSRLGSAGLEDPATPTVAAERCLPRPPRLGARIRFRVLEAELEARDRASRPRRGWGVLLELIVPFSGSRDFFALRGGAVPGHPPHAVVRNRDLVLNASTLTGDADRLVETLDAQLETIRRELEDQRRRCEGMREALVAGARQAVADRRRRLAVLRAAGQVLAGRGWRPRAAR